MRTLILGDVHGNEKFFARACRVAAREGCEAIMQVGDFGYWEHHPNGKRFLATAEWELKSRDLTCYWICGNHENHPLLWEKYGEGLMDTETGVHIDNQFVPVRDHILYVPRGARWEWDGTSFLGCGGAYSIDKPRRIIDGDGWWATEMITDEQVAASVAPGPVDVMFSHDAPMEFDLPAMVFKDIYPDSEYNRKQLSRIVTKVEPNLLVHGHYHHRYGSWLELRSGKNMRVEGLGADMDGDGRAWMVLDTGLEEKKVKIQ